MSGSVCEFMEESGVRIAWEFCVGVVFSCVNVEIAVLLCVSGVDCVDVLMFGVSGVAFVLMSGVCGCGIWLIGDSVGRLRGVCVRAGVGVCCVCVLLCRNMFSSDRPPLFRKLFIILKYSSGFLLAAMVAYD